MSKERTFPRWLGLLGVVSLLPYTAAVVLSPLAYPGYQWMAQAVSDLSAEYAPSKMLWSQLAAPYEACGLVSIMMVWVFVRGRLNKPLRLGIGLFAIMNWVSTLGYGMFPLSASGFSGTLQDILHTYVVTVAVVLLSIASLALIVLGGLRCYPSLSVWAGLALGMMLVGAIGVGVVPRAYFGIAERFSVFAATVFNGILGIYLFRGFPGERQPGGSGS